VHKVTVIGYISQKYLLSSVKREGRMGIINCVFQRTFYEVYEVSELSSDVQLVLNCKLRDQYNGKLHKNLL